jgi:DNA-binding NarL/FixJ family response regulator
MRATGGAVRPIRLLLCDDVPELRELLRDVFENDLGMRIVGEAENGRDCVALAADLQPDVVLLDLSMPEMDGLEVIPRLSESAPEAGIVVFSGFVAGRMGELAISLGADRYVEKGTPLDMLATAVQEVAEARRARDGGGGDTASGGGSGKPSEPGDGIVAWLRRWWPVAQPGI